jgi:hypothetical protein
VTAEGSASAIAILRDAYPRQEFPDRTVAFYARDLADIPGGELVPAVSRLIHRSRFLPSVAEIREEVAEARLALPDAAVAWDIALRGVLKDAPDQVLESMEAVGGRWSILHSENPEAVRAQFRRDYEERRKRAVLEEAGAAAPRLQLVARPEAARLMLPEKIGNGDQWAAPVLRREIRRLAGQRLDPPTDEEKSDAINILRAGPIGGDPVEDSLYRAAELVLVHADDAMREVTE